MKALDSYFLYEAKENLDINFTSFKDSVICAGKWMNNI